MARVSGAVLACVVFASCASDQSASRTEWPSAEMCSAAQLNWLVMVDRPAKNMLLIQRDSFGKASAGPVSRAVHEQAALACLAKRGRKCQLLASQEVQREIYQFAYTCEGG
jgi:hypothetical protein